jgi:predicted HTH transcriptional regulator
MSPDQLKKLLSQGEGWTVEFKKCVDALSNSVFETVCSFSNRYGAHILLGVDDNGRILGVNPDAAPKIMKNFINMLNNPQKISPSLYLSLEQVEVDGKLILYVYVPVGSQVELCSGKIFDRSFISEYTMDRFFLIGVQNVSVRSWIARELVSNILAHREYSSSFLSRVIIEKERIVTENWNRSLTLGKLDPDNFTPRSKNPIIARFFVNIGYADELGSGMRNLYRYTRIYTNGAEPELIEGDVFRTIIPLVSSAHPNNLSEGSLNVPVNVPVNITGVSKKNTDELILSIMVKEPEISLNAIAEKIGRARKTVQRSVKILKECGRVKRVGSDKTGHWEVLNTVMNKKDAFINND